MRTKVDDTITEGDVAMSLHPIQNDHLACCGGCREFTGIRHFVTDSFGRRLGLEIYL